MFGKHNYERANELHDAGEYDKAIPKYIKAIESGDLDENEIYFALVFLASCCIGQEDYDSARVNLDQALEWDDEYYQAYYEYGRSYVAQSDFASALEYFKQAIELEKNDVDTWHLCGLCYHCLDMEDEAKSALETALKLAIAEESECTEDIENALNEVKICLVTQEADRYFQEQEIELALEKYNLALNLGRGIIDHDNQAEIHRMKGKCFLSLKLPDDARREFDEAINLSKEVELLVLSDLGDYYFNKQEWESAEICYSKGMRICEGADVEIFTTMSLLTQAMKEWEVNKDGEKALKIIASVKPFDIGFVSLKTQFEGIILYSLGRYEEAVTCLRALLDDNNYDTRSMGCSYIGCSYQKMGHYETALRYIEEGIHTGCDKDSMVWVSKGDCHLNLKQYENALEAYRKALDYLEDDDEYTTLDIETKINAAKQMQAKDEAEKEAKKRPTHITIQGNNAAPINIGGILATDDAIINRATIQKEEEEVITAFCPQCGCKVDAEDRFCRKCGGKLK